MNTVLLSLLVALAVNGKNPTLPIRPTTQSLPPTRLAAYQLGTYLSTDGKRLRVNVNKQLGGEVYVQLSDRNGNKLFGQTMMPSDTALRLNLNLSELTDGDYQLKVSNGLEIRVRDLTISTPPPTAARRIITVL